MHAFAVETQIEHLRHVVIAAYDVDVGQRIAVAVNVYGVVYGYFGLQLSLLTEEHEDLVLYALGGIGGKARAFFGVKAVYRLYQPERPHGNKILLHVA